MYIYILYIYIYYLYIYVFIYIQNQKLIFLSSAPFHGVTFDHSVSFVLVIDNPNESCQNSKNFERNATPTTKKAFKKKRK